MGQVTQKVKGFGSAVRRRAGSVITTVAGHKKKVAGGVALLGAAALGAKYHSRVKKNRKIGVKRTYRKKP